MPIKKIGILFSGSGTNLENLLKKLHKKDFEDFSIEVALTLTNNEKAYGINRSRKFGIEPIILNHKNYNSREDFDQALVKNILAFDLDLVVLAGFMRILTPIFTSKIKAINVHPSLLPLFKGANAIKESYESPMLVAGVSVHFVNEILDGGELILQSAFERDKNMSFEDFENKIHEIEYEALPRAVLKVLRGTF